MHYPKSQKPDRPVMRAKAHLPVALQRTVLQTHSLLLPRRYRSGQDLLIAFCLLLQRLPHSRRHLCSQQFNGAQNFIMWHGANAHLRQEPRMTKEFVFI
jgi:hypothetical protein